MQPTYFHVSFRPSTKLISTVRRFTETFYDQMLADRELSERAALATHELLENAVAYASDSEASVRVEVQDGYLAVKTWNRANPARIAELAARIETLATGEPSEHYLSMMEQTAFRSEGSGLGLARIRAEAAMTLTYELTDDSVCIQARAPIGRTEGSR
jgi:hypothetical protein